MLASLEKIESVSSFITSYLTPSTANMMRQGVCCKAHKYNANINI